MSEENTPAERPSVIEWQTESCESSTKQVSPDGRWHLSIDVKRDGKPRAFLNNYDILCSPCGSGENTLECWRKFIAECESYLVKVAAIKTEAEAILAAIENETRENEQ